MMTRVILPLKKMTIVQKMDVLEKVWESMRLEQEKLDSPAWHEKLLAERKKLFKTGKTKFIPWSEAKESIRRRVHARQAA